MVVYVGYQLKGLVLYWKNFESGTSNTTNTSSTGNQQHNRKDPDITETIPKDTQNSRTSYPNPPSNNPNPPSNNPKPKPKSSVIPPQVIKSSVPIELDDLIKAVDTLISEQGYNKDVTKEYLELLKESFEMEQYMENKQKDNPKIYQCLSPVLRIFSVVYFMTYDCSVNFQSSVKIQEGSKIYMIVNTHPIIIPYLIKFYL